MGLGVLCAFVLHRKCVVSYMQECRTGSVGYIAFAEDESQRYRNTINQIARGLWILCLGILPNVVSFTQGVATLWAGSITSIICNDILFLITLPIKKKINYKYTEVISAVTSGVLDCQ